MSRSTIEKVLIGVVTFVLGALLLTFITNIVNAASEEDLNNVKLEMESYTDKAIKIHEAKEAVKYETLTKSVTEIENQMEWFYLRELEKADKELYLKELERLKTSD